MASRARRRCRKRVRLVNCLVRFHVRCVYFHAHCLADQIYRQDQPRVCALAGQTAEHALERTACDFDHFPFADERAWVVLEIALHQAADAVDLRFGDRRQLAVEGDNADHTRALQDRKAIVRIEARKTVAREERPVDLLLPVLPAAPFTNRRKKSLVAFRHDLIANDLLVPRPRPNGKPRRRCVHGWLGVRPSWPRRLTARDRGRRCSSTPPAVRKPCAVPRSSTR